MNIVKHNIITAMGIETVDQIKWSDNLYRKLFWPLQKFLGKQNLFLRIFIFHIRWNITAIRILKYAIL